MKNVSKRLNCTVQPRFRRDLLDGKLLPDLNTEGFSYDGNGNVKASRRRESQRTNRGCRRMRPGRGSVRMAGAIACLLAMLFGGLSLYWMLGDGAAQLPLAAGSIFALLAWIGIPLLAIATAFPWSRTRKRSRLEKAGAVARLVFGLIGMAALALLTDVGILLAGHSYWIDRAFTARTDAESRRCLRVVLGSTQYGRDLVANALAGLPPGERRRELEVAFGEMTDLPRRGPEKIGR